MRGPECTQLVSTSARQRSDLLCRNTPAQQAAHRLSSRLKSCTCGAGDGSNNLHLHASEPYRGPNNPVSGYRTWLPGGGLVHVRATVDPSAIVEAAAVVQEGANVGKDCRIGSGSVVGPGVTVGDKSQVEFQVALQHCSLGSQCLLHSGSKVGARGFVFRPSAAGTLEQPREHQTFRAEIRDNVEVGANAVIDRGSWRDTVIDKGAKLDSLVHIGHDCTIGRDCIICSSASVGASSSLGDEVIVGNRAAIKDHVSVAAGTRIAAKAGIVRDISKAGDYAGHPAMPAEDFKKQVARGVRGQVPVLEGDANDYQHQQADETGAVT